MLTVLRDAQGQLVAACEWWQGRLDSQGQPDPSGDRRWIWVEQLEVNEGVSRLDRMQVIHQVIDRVAMLVPEAIGCYFTRRDKTGETIKHYFRNQLVRQMYEEVS